MGGARFSQRGPAGDANGLAPIIQELVADPKRIYVAIVLIDAKTINKDTDTGAAVPTIRVRRIEVVTDRADAGHMRRLLQREFERRTGRATLPFELEQEIRDVFGEDQAT